MKKRIASVFVATVLLLAVFSPVRVSAAYENTYQNTGDQRSDIIGVALTQVGYTEESGGYTKYGDWFGRPTADWCGIFISWCAEQAGVPTSVLRRNGIAKPSSFGLSTYYESSQYTPKPGDLFFSKGFSHAGIVYYVDGDSFYTLEGNTWYNGSAHSVMIRKRALNEYYFASPNYNGSGGELPASCSHSWKDDSVIKEAGCTSSGSKYQVCTKCSGKRTVSISATGHSYAEWAFQDEENHEQVCTKCKDTKTEKHDQAQWSSDTAGHWKVCETCEEQLQVAPHTYEGECGTSCTVCGYVNQSGHNYGAWRSNETGHYQVCTACEKVGQTAEHTYGAECAESCQDCGHIRETDHSFEQKADGSGHWLCCTVCGKAQPPEDHVPGPEADERTGQNCTVCGYELAPKAEHIHVFTYTSSRDAHWGQCACGAPSESESHTWSMESGGCSICGVAAAVAEEPKNWDLVWIMLGASVAGAGLITAGIILLKKRKRKIKTAV